MRRVLFSCLLAGTLGAGTAWAHHTMPGRTHPTVTISQSVMVDGKPLPAGTYELWVTDQRPDLGAGAPSDAQRIVELAQKGQVIARATAEVFPRAARDAIGTSGASATRARAQLLRGGEFLRVSFTDADGRFLLHFPTGPLNQPAPQPQAPSRLELPPGSTPIPQTAPATPATPATPAPDPAPPSNRP